MVSTDWFTVCAAGYALALFIFIFNLVQKKASIRRLGTVVTSLAFLGQTTGMAFRWHEAGLIELAAVERAADVQLEGMARWVVYSQHPPWSNLYEIMVFMAWGIILVFLVSEVKWRIRFAGIFALIIALIPFGLVSLGGLDGTIKPLVPALQSWWIMIHVISSAVGYSAGTMGAILSLLYLIKAKDKLSLTALGGGVMALSAFLFPILGRGTELFTSGQYRVKLLGYVEGKLEPAGAVIDGSFKPFYVPSPGVGILLIVAIVICYVAAVVLMRGAWAKLLGKLQQLWRSGPPGMISAVVVAVVINGLLGFLPLLGMIFVATRGGAEQTSVSDRPEGLDRILFFAAFAVSTATLALVLFNAMTQTDFQLSAETAQRLAHGAPAPWRLHVLSNQWDLALFFIIWGGQLFVTIAILKADTLRTMLPSAERLDRGAYYTILIAFALVAVVLVTGALWAHYAWGRYWGWDPKETGALVIWLTYAIYLHTRVTYGWVGVPSAVIGILGFFVIIAGFLGVNLGWFADGLHSYGSS